MLMEYEEMLRRERIPKRNYKSDTNKVFLVGEILQEFELFEEIENIQFFKSQINIQRFMSMNVDSIPIMVTKELLQKYSNKKFTGRKVEIVGEIRSYDKDVEGHIELNVYIYVDEINLENDGKMSNISYLDGYICKEPFFKITSETHRKATILLVANNREDGSDYIPCIVWGKAALWARHLEVGEHINLLGIVQSTSWDEKTVYQISVRKISLT